jgi:hypothetical protein
MATTLAKLFSTGVLQSRGEIDEYSTSVLPSGQQVYTTPGTYSWTAPAGVTSVSVVAVGGGGGGSIGGYSGNGYATSGGGGGLGWKNNITVVPGQTYTVVVGVAGGRGPNPSNQPGTDGGNSYFISTSTVMGGKGLASGTGGTYVGDGGGNGGLGRGGGGGAGGYSGNGGNGETNWDYPSSSNDATIGSGGGGGGGTCSAGMDSSSNGQAGGGGGGVGLLGQGTNGSKGQPAGQIHTQSGGGSVQSWRGGGGGSDGTSAVGTSNTAGTKSGNAGQYGGGGGGWGTGYSSDTLGGNGGAGAVRIIWGTGRAFPSTTAGDVVSSEGPTGGASGNPLIRVTPTNIYAREFDEVSLTPSIGLGLTGNVLVNERGYGIAVDSSGNRYGVGNIGEGSLIKFSLIKNDTTGNVAWQRELTGSELHTQGFKIVTDSSGNVYAVGADQLNSSPYTVWVVVVKFNSSGAIQWQRRLETNNNTISSSIALDTSNNVYIVTSDYGATSNLIAAKYDSSGTIQWQKRFYSTTGAGSEGTGLAVDSAGNVYACGRAFGSAFIVKFNTAGVYQWVYSLSGPYAYGMTVDLSDNLYMVGNMYNSVSAKQEMVLLKIDSSGTQQWQRTLGKTSTDTYGYATTVDSSGNVYVTGITNTVWDIYIAKYNTLGTLQWQRTLGSTAYELGQSIKISSTGDIHVTGGSTISGTEDVFFATLPGDGSRTGTHIIGGYSFNYSESSMTAATSTLSYSSGISGSPFTTSNAGLTESAGVLTVATSALTVTTNSGGGTIPAERRSSTGKYFVSGYFDEVSLSPDNEPGQSANVVAGSSSFTIPTGVTTISAVVIGGGGGGAASINSGNSTSGGGGGGGLSWKNNIPVTPGETLTVVVGAGGTGVGDYTGGTGGDSYIARGGTILLKANGGKGGVGNNGNFRPSYLWLGGNGGEGGTAVDASYGGANGGKGGNGGSGSTNYRAGGGGAGGYSGTGGAGGPGGGSYNAGGAGSGGGGGGGASTPNSPYSGGGGGTGLNGEGTSGAGGGAVTPDIGNPAGGVGKGGSGGSDGVNYTLTGGSYGGGGSGSTGGPYGNGAPGAVRIIWGIDRGYPSTGTTDSRFLDE